MDRAPLYRLLAERYGWDARKVARMTPAQLLMYLDGPAAGPGEPGATWTDPKTGHTMVRVGSRAEAMRLLASRGGV